MSLFDLMDLEARGQASSTILTVLRRRHPAAPVMSISRLAEATGVTLRALRYYESKGLIRPIRSRHGARHYPPGEAEAARTVVFLRSLGLGLPQIARLLEPGRPPSEVVEDLHVMLSSRLSELKDAQVRVQAAIADVTQITVNPDRVSGRACSGS